MQLTSKSIDADSIQKDIVQDNEGGKYGAVVTFFGTVRELDERNGHQHHIRAIDYETYTELFVGETRKLIDEVRELFQGRLGRVAIVHRVDRVRVGETTAALVVSAVHRKDALRAIELLTDGMKKRVPIWKKVIRNDGQEHLVRMSNQ